MIQYLTKDLDPHIVKNNNNGWIIPIVLSTSLKLIEVIKVDNKKPYLIIDFETVSIAGHHEYLKIVLYNPLNYKTGIKKLLINRRLVLKIFLYEKN